MVLNRYRPQTRDVPDFSFWNPSGTGQSDTCLRCIIYTQIQTNDNDTYITVLNINIIIHYYAAVHIGRRNKAVLLLTSVWRLMSVCLTSVCLSVAYIMPNSRTERPRKTKIGTVVAHVTHDSDTTFKVKSSKDNLLLMS